MSNKDDDNEEKAEKASVGAVPYDAEDPGDTDDHDEDHTDGVSIDVDVDANHDNMSFLFLLDHGSLTIRFYVKLCYRIDG